MGADWWLQSARDYQVRIALLDDTAAEILQNLCRDRVEALAKQANDTLKKSGRTAQRDVTGAMSAMEVRSMKTCRC